MEEWVGAQWHRFIQRAANKQHDHAVVPVFGRAGRATGCSASLAVVPTLALGGWSPKPWRCRPPSRCSTMWR
jgi:nitric oxide reductase NorD protein